MRGAAKRAASGAGAGHQCTEGTAASGLLTGDAGDCTELS